MKPVRIATRKSPLALWQADHVADRLREAHPGIEVSLVPMSTQGDKLLDAPLAKVGGKGLFVKELENALLDGRADIAVHSMKDVPVAFPDGLHLPVVLARGDHRDALVSNRFQRLDALPEGAKVGTSSLRRHCQILLLRPDVQVENLRGGVGTRLAKLDAGDYDAIVLACAGLQRLRMTGRIAEALEAERMLPAIGQGAVGIECREDDTELTAMMTPLRCAGTSAVLAAERALNERLGGGCQVPVAAYAVLEDSGNSVYLRALVATTDASRVLREEGRAATAGAGALGAQLAEKLLARGAGAILDGVYRNA